AQVKDNGVEDVQVRLAGVAAGSTHLTELQRAAKESAGLVVEGLSELQCLILKNQIFASPCSQTKVLSVANDAFRARFHAVSAEQTASQVQAEGVAVQHDCVRRAGFGAGATAIRASGRINHGPAAKAIW